MSDVRTVAANSSTGNVLAGKLHEILPSPSVVRLLALGAAVGVRVTLIIGSEVLISDQEIPAGTGFPLFPDHVIVEGAGFKSDRLFLDIRNTTGAGIVVQTAVDTIPI